MFVNGHDVLIHSQSAILRTTENHLSHFWRFTWFSIAIHKLIYTQSTTTKNGEEKMIKLTKWKFKSTCRTTQCWTKIKNHLHKYLFSTELQRQKSYIYMQTNVYIQMCVSIGQVCTMRKTIHTPHTHSLTHRTPTICILCVPCVLHEQL